MVERYGIQDHDPKLIQHALQNPTNPHVHVMPGAADPAQNAAFVYNTGVFAPDKPLSKGIVTSLLLALVCGPFGLLYTTWRGGIALIALMVLAGRIRGGSMEAVSSDAVMYPIWVTGVAISVVWTYFAAIAYNHRHKEAYDARKAREKEGAS